jgi:hypothetical protein
LPKKLDRNHTPIIIETIRAGAAFVTNERPIDLKRAGLIPPLHNYESARAGPTPFHKINRGIWLYRSYEELMFLSVSNGVHPPRCASPCVAGN